MSSISDAHGPKPFRTGETDDLRAVGDAVDVSADVYARIVRQVAETTSQLSSLEAAPEPAAETAVAGELTPRAPETFEDAGISLSQLSELVLKTMYLNGTLSGFEISRHLRLPLGVVAKALDFLKSEHCLEVASGEIVGNLSNRFLLTRAGRSRAREAFSACRYVGPAPVSLDQYTQQCRRQAVHGISLSLEQFQAAFADLVIDPDLLARLGSAVCSGQSIFLYGPSGNGKTVIGKALGRLLNSSGGSIYVPYAISVDNQIISVYDPTLHRVVESPPGSEASEADAQDDESAETAVPDGRWQRVRRPIVTTGGELSLNMLELRHHAASGYYTAPIHLKANGGVFLLDDFGRQLVPAVQLLNRWILPLEEHTDHLTLATGKKFAIPFEQLIIFSTNLQPEELVDAAFLRRIRHKIEIGHPTEKQFREIFRRCCEQRKIKYDDWIVTRLLTSQYDPQTPPKSSDPRDLLDGIDAICRFRGERPHLSEHLILQAYRECLCGPRLQP